MESAPATAALLSIVMLAEARIKNTAPMDSRPEGLLRRGETLVRAKKRSRISTAASSLKEAVARQECKPLTLGDRTLLPQDGQMLPISLCSGNFQSFDG